MAQDVFILRHFFIFFNKNRSFCSTSIIDKPKKTGVFLVILKNNCNLAPDFNLLTTVNDIQTIQNDISDTSGEIAV